MEFVEHVKIYSKFAGELGMHAKPKRHQLLHMAHIINEYGSPSWWGCWAEEGMNRWLGKVCNSAHRAVWHARVLCEFNETWGPGRQRTRPMWQDLQP